MLAVFLLCAAFALSGATEPQVESAAEQHPPLDEAGSTVLDQVKEMMVAAEQNESPDGRPEELLAEKTERLEEEEAVVQEVAADSMSGDGVESRSRCPSGWSTYGSRCFIFINRPSAWAAAERYCLHFGANLASIHSSQEHHFVQELVRWRTGGFTKTWIGGTDAFQNRLWFWTDGSRFNFQAWSRGEPNNNRGREPCIEMNFGAASLWNDLACGNKRPFVCAKKRNC